MKYFLVALSAAFLTVSSAFACPGDGKCSDKDCMSGKKWEMKLDKMDKTLDLTDDQRAKIEEIMKTSHDEFQPEKEAFHEKMKAHKAQVNEDIKAVLNEDQAKKFEKKMEKKKGKHKKGKKSCHHNH